MVKQKTDKPSKRKKSMELILIFLEELPKGAFIARSS